MHNLFVAFKVTVFLDGNELGKAVGQHAPSFWIFVQIFSLLLLPFFLKQNVVIRILIFIYSALILDE